VSDSVADKLYIGLDVGRTIRGALFRVDGSSLRQRRVISEVTNARVFIDQLIDVINSLRNSAEAGGRAAAVGIGWAGLVNQPAQRIEVNPNLVDVSSFDLRQELEQATNLPIVIDNDANAAAYGDWQCAQLQRCIFCDDGNRHRLRLDSQRAVTARQSRVCRRVRSCQNRARRVGMRVWQYGVSGNSSIRAQYRAPRARATFQ